MHVCMRECVCVGACVDVLEFGDLRSVHICLRMCRTCVLVVRRVFHFLVLPGQQLLHAASMSKTNAAIACCLLCVCQASLALREVHQPLPNYNCV